MVGGIKSDSCAVYEILLKRIDLAAQPTVLNVKNLQGLTYTASSLTLTPGAQYRWWVRGLDASGNGYPWSQPRNFTVTDLMLLKELRTDQ